MEDKVFLLVKVTIRTSYQNIQDAIAELQDTDVELTSTANVKVLRTNIVSYGSKKRSSNEPSN